MSEAARARRAAAAALVAVAVLAPPAEAQRMRGITSARQLSGERALDVQVQYGAGRLTVAPEASGLMYRMEMRYDEARWRPVAEYAREGGRLRLGLAGVRGREEIRSRSEDYARVSLTPAVPMDLDLEFGAGRAEVELGGLSLRSLELSTGASETRLSFSEPNRVPARSVRIEAGAASIDVVKLGNARAEVIEFNGGLGEATLDFTGEWTRSARASIRMGVGSVRLRVPRGLGVRVRKESFMASFDSRGMVRRGNAWFSRDYDSAAHRLDIAIDAAIGSISIDWVD